MALTVKHARCSGPVCTLFHFIGMLRGELLDLYIALGPMRNDAIYAEFAGAKTRLRLAFTKTLSKYNSAMFERRGDKREDVRMRKS